MTKTISIREARELLAHDLQWLEERGDEAWEQWEDLCANYTDDTLLLWKTDGGGSKFVLPEANFALFSDVGGGEPGSADWLFTPRYAQALHRVQYTRYAPAVDVIAECDSHGTAKMIADALNNSERLALENEWLRAERNRLLEALAQARSAGSA